MYDMKAFYEAESVAGGDRLRVAYPDAQIIAGGSDVLVQMREGKRAGAELISIYGSTPCGAFPWSRMGPCGSVLSPASPISPRIR